jgi:Ca2+-binding EF-hand superfamily protein
LKTALSARGVRGLINLKRQFKLADTDGSNSLDYVEFLKAFNDLKIANVAESEVKMLFDLFDSDNDGQIQYLKFLDHLVGKLNPVRSRLVTEAFQSLDANQNGLIELDELKAKFDPSRHPEVRANLKTVEEARFEFFNLFTTLHSANNQFKNERSVSLQDFEEYH